MASTPRSPDLETQGPRVVFVNILLLSRRHSEHYYYHSWSTQGGERTTSNKIGPVLLCFMPIFLGLLQLKYGGGGAGASASPYKTHPLTMGFSIACLLAGWLACLLKNVCLPVSSLPGAYGHALERVTLLLGSWSLASLVTLLLPSSWTTHSYVVYALLSGGLGALVCSMLLKCKLRTSSENDIVCGNLLLSGASSVGQETDLPV